LLFIAIPHRAEGERIVADGTPARVESTEDPTARALRAAARPARARRKARRFLEVLGATENNLRNVDVRIPLAVSLARMPRAGCATARRTVQDESARPAAWRGRPRWVVATTATSVASRRAVLGN
jgi:hypothetical protein